jgi:hypothetical protein
METRRRRFESRFLLRIRKGEKTMPKKKVTFDIKQWLKAAQKELKKAKKARAVPMKLASRRDIDALYYNVDLERDLRKVVDTLTELSKCMISPHSVSKE